ncbi:MAG: mechanosensitive ion channel domain-containing protein [Shimia sp.]
MRFLVLTLLLTFATAVPAQDTQPTGAIATGGGDLAIAERLSGILSELDGFEDVAVTVSQGIVTLSGTTLDAAKIAQLDAIVGRLEGVVAIENEVTESTDLGRRIDPLRDRFEARIAQVVAFAPLLLIAAALFAAVLLAGLRLARAGMWDRAAPNAFIADIYRMCVRIAFAIVGLVLALDILNATALLSTILGAAGIIGLAVGFAVRDTVENFIASVMLSIRQPFRPNDAVEIEGDQGLVIRLTSRATILLDFDGNHIRIPNATVFKARIVNFTRNAQRRFTFEIGVASDADLAAVRHLAEDTVAGLPFTLDEPAPATWIERIGDGAIFLTVTGWIDQRDTNLLLARGEALRKVKAAIEAAGVEVPDTTYRIDLLPRAGAALQVTETEDDPPPDTEAASEAARADDDIRTRAPDALDRLVEVERRDETRPDLLREDAPEE